MARLTTAFCCSPRTMTPRPTSCWTLPGMPRLNSGSLRRPRRERHPSRPRNPMERGVHRGRAGRLRRELGLDERMLYWVGSPDARAPSPPGRAVWPDLEEREARRGFRDRQPILVDPDYRVDPRLSELFRRSRFATRAPGTQESYALDYRLLFTFLWRQGRYWDQARPEDLEDYEYWRRKDQRNPVRVGGAKWARELAAFRLLYTWAARHGHVPGSPVVVHTHQRRDGRTVEVAELAPRDVRSTNVKWLTPRAYRLWRDVGLRGYRADGLLDDAWRGRNEGRDAAFADLLLSSGLRRREAATLLLAELPEANARQRYSSGRIAVAVAKRRGRYFYVSQAALKAVETYRVTTRAAAVGGARDRPAGHGALGRPGRPGAQGAAGRTG